MSISPISNARTINRLLKMAVVGGVEASVRLHIDRGDDLDARDDRGLTPLMIAAARNKAGICRLLIDAGADMLALDPTGRDALTVAREAGAPESASTIEVALSRRVAQAGQPEPSAEHVAARESEICDERGNVSALLVNDEAWNGAQAGSVAAGSPVDVENDRSEETAERERQVAQDTSSSADIPIEEPSTVANIIKPPSLDEDDASALDTSGWDADEERAPPPDDASLAAAQAAIQRIIAKHAPIDDSADWEHFEAFLPEHAAPFRRTEDAESTAELRRLLLRALREGSVPEFDAEDLCSGRDGLVDSASLSLLRFVINDLGAETDERFEYRLPHENFEVFVDPAETQDEEEVVGDAMALLDDLESHRNDPMRLYMRDAQRRSLITAEEETVLARAMEDAAKQAIDALASWSYGIRLVLAALEKARSGQRPLKSITAGQRDDVEPDHGEFVEREDIGFATPVAVLGMESEEKSEAITSDDADATQGEDAATEPLPIGFFEHASELSALVSSGFTQEADASDVRVVLASLYLKRTFLMELADAAAGDKSEDASRFRAAVRSLSASRERMAGANLRLVLSIAKRYLYSGLPMDDLVQEGNIGLLKAVDKFDWRRGYKFSTMATWWIRQQVSRSVGDDARMIRLPVHIHEKLQRVERKAEAMARSSGRAPSSTELAAKLSMAPAMVDTLLRASPPPLPLDSMDSDGDVIVECIEDPRADAFQMVAAAELGRALNDALDELDPRPAKILRLRFGIGVADALTLEEVGALFDVTRERIRQIESKAIRRLQHPLRLNKLRPWIDGDQMNPDSDKPSDTDGSEALPQAVERHPSPSRANAASPARTREPERRQTRRQRPLRSGSAVGASD